MRSSGHGQWPLVAAAFSAGLLLGCYLAPAADDGGLAALAEQLRQRLDRGRPGGTARSGPAVDNRTGGKHSDAGDDDVARAELRLRRSLLAAGGRILCWVMTAEKEKRTPYRKAIMDTWGKRCAKVLFVVGGSSAGGSVESPDALSGGTLLRLAMPENYQHLWQKTKLAFRHVHARYTTADYDWVLKVDDDAYVIVENLQLFLRTKAPSSPHFYGCEYKATGGYNSGGPGYVLSMENVPKLVRALNASQCSQSPIGSEDAELAKCLRVAGIRPGDTRDKDGRFRFSPFTPENTIDHATLHPRYKWFWGFTAHKLKQGLDCCADDFISFHYITPSMMYATEYLVYYAHPFSNRRVWNEPLVLPPARNRSAN